MEKTDEDLLVWPVVETTKPGLSPASYSAPAQIRALRGVAYWLGFESVESYLTALYAERERIFERSTY